MEMDPELQNLRIPNGFHSSGQFHGSMGILRESNPVQNQTGGLIFLIVLLVIVFVLLCIFFIAAGCRLCKGKRKQATKWLTPSKTRNQRGMKRG